MNDIDVTSILRDMQRLMIEAREGAPPEAAPSVEGFAQLLRSSIDKVNEMQLSAAQAAESFERGAADITLPEVMIALQKANLSFQAMTEVRNHLVNAYQEIMNMPV